MSFLGIDQSVYNRTFFTTEGKVSDSGLTVPGVSLAFGKAEIWTQDASIMGWTCGMGTAAAKDVARFYYDLLGPTSKIVS